jgi:ferritin-like metal-binding protein YciE
MNLNDFQDLYLAELSELRSVERQMADHLQTLSGRATSPTLSDAVTAHQDETQAHCRQIGTLLQDHGAQAEERHDDTSMHAIISETEKWTSMIDDSHLKDAALIASLQRMEHYEIAVLGTLANWAKKLGHENDASVLSEILEQDKSADARLSEIADDTVAPTLP